MMRVPQKFQDMLDGRPGDEPIDAHSVQFYYTIVLAHEAGMTIDVKMTDDLITYTAK